MGIFSKLFSKAYGIIGLGIIALVMMPTVSFSQSEEDILNSIGSELEDESAKKKEAARVEKEYKAFKSKADAAYTKKLYDKAKEYYGEMVKLKPESDYATSRITLMDEKIAQAKAAESKKKYNDLIKQADALLASENWSDATSKYQAALALSPDESYPKTQIAKVTKMKTDAEAAAKAAVVQQKYDDALSSAERALSAKNWDVAKQKFNEAAKIKPSESYPREKAAMIDKFKAEAIAEAKRKQKDKEYTDKLAQADQLFATKDFSGAIAIYESAKGLKPSEAYPTEQIKKANERIKILADNKAKAEKLETDFQKHKKDGEAAMTEKNWLVAIQSFTTASSLKPGNTDITSLLNQAKSGKKAADELALKQKAEQEALVKTQKQYDSEMAKGASALSAKNWAEARTSFTKAKGLKPEETDPDLQLTKLDQLVKAEKDAEAAAEAQKLADEKAAQEKAEEEARLAAEKKAAEEAKAAEEKRIAEEAAASAESERLAAEAAEKARLEQEAILAAEKKAADEAKAAEEKRLAEEAAAAAEAERLAAEQEEKRKQEEAAKLAAEADEKEKARLAEEAAAAAVLLADQKEKAEAERLAAEQEEKRKKEEAAKLAAEADEKEKARLAEEAAAAALLLAEQKEQAEAERLETERLEAERMKAEKEKLAQESEQNQRGFDKAISDYKSAIAGSEWDLALRAINSAETFYPENPEIDKMQSELASLQKAETEALNAEKAKEAKALALEKEFQSTIKSADAALALKDFATAKTAYNSAIKLKPNDDYPKNQLDVIKEMELAANADALAAQQQKDKEFSDFMAKGEEAMLIKDWTTARSSFTNASKVKPDSNGPQERLADLTSLEQKEKDLANAAAELEEDYAERMKNGQKALDAKQFADAKRFFFGASKLKPTESLPKEKVKETEALWAAEVEKEKQYAAQQKEEQLEANYNGFISSGDRALENEMWDEAISSYQGAIELKQEEAYPKQKLSEAKNGKSEAMAEAEKERAEAQALAIAAEKERLKLEAEQKAKADLETNFTNAMANGNMAMNDSKYRDAVKSFSEALKLKPESNEAKSKLEAAKVKFAAADADRKAAEEERRRLAGIELEKRREVARIQREAYLEELNKNSPEELAKKYPDGITEEVDTENELVVTKSIIVENNAGRYLIRFDYPWGEHFYYLDGKKIREDAYNWNIRKYKF